MFAAVGLAPCGLSTASAPVGTTFSIPFSVFDDGLPQLWASVNRTVLIVSPCSSGQRTTLVALLLSTSLEQVNTYCTSARSVGKRIDTVASCHFTKVTLGTFCTSCMLTASPTSLRELCVSTFPFWKQGEDFALAATFCR